MAQRRNFSPSLQWRDCKSNQRMNNQASQFFPCQCLERGLAELSKDTPSALTVLQNAAGLEIFEPFAWQEKTTWPSSVILVLASASHLNAVPVPLFGNEAIGALLEDKWNLLTPNRWSLLYGHMYWSRICCLDSFLSEYGRAKQTDVKMYWQLSATIIACWGALFAWVEGPYMEGSCCGKRHWPGALLSGFYS